MKKQKTTTKALTLQKQITPDTEQATALKITSHSSLEKATALLSSLNTSLDRITEEKEKVTKPLNEALKAERLRWKPLETTLEASISLVRNKISQYQTNIIKEQKQAETELLNKVETGKISLEKATEKLSSITAPSAIVATPQGSLRFRTDKILKITNEKAIPREYLIPDEKKILDTLKLGTPVAGCEIEEIQTPINVK